MILFCTPCAKCITLGDLIPFGFLKKNNQGSIERFESQCERLFELNSLLWERNKGRGNQVNRIIHKIFKECGRDESIGFYEFVTTNCVKRHLSIHLKMEVSF